MLGGNEVCAMCSTLIQGQRYHSAKARSIQETAALYTCACFFVCECNAELLSIDIS